MKKLLFINQTLDFGGAETFNSDLINWLNHTGKWNVVSYVTQKKLYENLVKTGNNASRITTIVDVIGNIRGLIKGVIYLPVLIIKYFRIINEHKDANIIFMTGFIEKILVTPIAKIYNIPVVWMEFAPLDKIFQKFFGMPRFLYSLVETFPIAVMVPTQNTLSRIKKTTHIPAHRLIFQKLGRNISLLTSKRQIRGHVVCISRLEPGKGQDYLLKAWKIIVDQVPHAKLTIVGQGSNSAYLHNLVDSLEMNKTVKFLHTASDADVLHTISSAQVCAFPSLWPLEGFGLVALEAMSLNKPLVGFKYGPLPEIISSDVGILVDPGNIDQLAQAIIKLLKNSNLSRKMGTAGHVRFKKYYSFQKIGPAFSNIFINFAK